MTSPLIPVTQTVTPFPVLDATDWYAWATDVDTWIRATASGSVSGVGLAPNIQTGNYTLTLNDEMALVAINSASAQTVTIPPNSSVAFPLGSQVYVAQVGAGQVTIAGGTGVTVRVPSGRAATTRGLYSIVTLRQGAANTWYVKDDLTRTDLDPAAQAYVDNAVATVPLLVYYTSGAWPNRPNTSASGRPVDWMGPAPGPAGGGTLTGGTAAYAPGDRLFLS